MKYSEEIHGIKAREKLLKGASRVNEAVSTTLGIRGRNVVTWQPHRTRLLHDGLKVSETVNPKDPHENAGAEIIKQSARQTVGSVGDGTTLTILLAYSIMEEALKITNSGINPMSLKSGLEKGRDLLIKRIKELSKPITTKEQKIQVATISSEDGEMGKMIGETYEKAGVDAVITAEDTVGETFIDHQEGLQIDSGFKHELFVTNPKNMTATLNKARILVTDYKMNDIFELVPLLDLMVGQQERSLIVIAEDIEGNVLATLIKNKLEGKMNFLAIKAPSYQKEKVLQDIATVVGAKFITSSAKFDMKKLTLDDLGYAERITSTKDATVIVGGGGKKNAVKERIESIREQLKDEENDFQKEKLRERLSKLTGGVYVIKVGGRVESEAEERRERAEDSILSTRSAINSGTVPGGETTFLFLDDVLVPENEEEDYSFRILRNAIRKPFHKLLSNAGLESGEIMIKIKEKGFGYGANVVTGEVVNMIKEGIIDPTEVLIEALGNATSVAISLITSNCVIAEVEEKDK